MLFNSYEFVLLFLPIVVVGYHALSKFPSVRLPLVWLVLSSLFFYGWWNPKYLFLIIASVLFNYNLGRVLSQVGGRRGLLILGVGANLTALGYFKYANFFADNLNHLGELQFELQEIILPLAISFFTFQQVAYLVDAYRGVSSEQRFLQYCLFVTFFPQLIAGPIVHHQEMIPQFRSSNKQGDIAGNVAVGITIFVIGLFKKVVLADNIAPYANAVFGAAEAGVEPSFIEAWGGALAYTFQLYFDFSGYCDMAVGIALMFGIRLPINFNSPYKATSIIDFWRRWHITLSRFLRDYLYVSLGGNRKGTVRRYVNLFITMLLGGLWHGAGWTFVCWGALHGVYLMINHAWRLFMARMGLESLATLNIYLFVSRFLTLLAVICGWVLFRAESFEGAFIVLKGMFAFNGIVLPAGYLPAVIPAGVYAELGIVIGALDYFGGVEQLTFLLLLAAVALFAPNSYELTASRKPVCDFGQHKLKPSSYRALTWAANRRWAFLTASLFVLSLMSMTRVSEFLYFQF